MIERLSRAWRNAALVALAALVLWFCWSIRAVINPLLLGYLLAYILHPAVQKLEDRGLSRRSSVVVIFVGGFLLMTGILVGVVLQTRNLVHDVVTDQEVRAEIGSRFDAFWASLEQRFGQDVVPSRDSLPDLGAAIDWMRAFVAEHREAAQTAGGAAVEAAGGVLGVIGDLLGTLIAIGGLFVLVPLYTYYLLFELGRVNGWFRRYIPRGERERMTRVATQIGEVLASFFRGRLLVCLLKGGVIFVGLLVLGIPYAFLFGMLGGFLSIIPIVGPLIGFVGALSIGILDHGVLGSFLRAGAVFGVAEILEGYVFIPKIMGDSLGLHEVVVLFALLAGGAALGMFGVLIALPVAAVLVILFREFVVPALTAWVEEEPVRPPPSGPPTPAR
jgi:predicted PurR-regulated permease PerM